MLQIIFHKIFLYTLVLISVVYSLDIDDKNYTSNLINKGEEFYLKNFEMKYFSSSNNIIVLTDKAKALKFSVQSGPGSKSFITQTGTNKVLDVHRMQFKLLIYPKHGKQNQQFTIQYKEGNKIKLLNTRNNTDYCVTSTGKNLFLKDCEDSPNNVLFVEFVNNLLNKKDKPDEIKNEFLKEVINNEALFYIKKGGKYMIKKAAFSELSPDILKAQQLIKKGDIISQINTNKVFDYAVSSSRLLFYTKHGNSNQHFKLVPVFPNDPNSTVVQIKAFKSTCAYENTNGGIFFKNCDSADTSQHFEVVSDAINENEKSYITLYQNDKRYFFNANKGSNAIKMQYFVDAPSLNGNKENFLQVSFIKSPNKNAKGTNQDLQNNSMILLVPQNNKYLGLIDDTLVLSNTPYDLNIETKDNYFKITVDGRCLTYDKSLDSLIMRKCDKLEKMQNFMKTDELISNDFELLPESDRLIEDFETSRSDSLSKDQIKLLDLIKEMSEKEKKKNKTYSLDEILTKIKRIILEKQLKELDEKEYSSNSNKKRQIDLNKKLNYEIIEKNSSNNNMNPELNDKVITLKKPIADRFKTPND
ncbi:hypothetical protein NUSPORA_01699 [Nucleospora cyclopteri]